MAIAAAFTVPVTKCFKQEVEMSSLDRAKMKETFERWAWGVENKNIKIEDGISTNSCNRLDPGAQRQTDLMTRKPPKRRTACQRH